MKHHEQRVPDKATLLETQALLRPFLHRTPVLRSAALDRLAGCALFFKTENFQKTGSFKARGALNAVLRSVANVDHFITHSSGNHGQALAWAAAQKGAKATIVMPENAPRVKVDAVRDYGGEVVFCATNQAAREATMADLRERSGAAFVPPYDDYHIIAGQASATLELLEEVPNLDMIWAPVGGGGLVSGAALAVHYMKPEVEVWAGEPAGADDAYRSFYGSKHVRSQQPRTVADGLLTTLGVLNYQLISRHLTGIVRVTDEEIIAAMRLIYERLKIVIEPSCAVPLAAILQRKGAFAERRLGLIISGGNVDLNRLPF